MRCRHWADQEIFEAYRAKMLQYGISMDISVEELFRITDPDRLLDLWTAAEATGAQCSGEYPLWFGSGSLTYLRSFRLPDTLL
jgi:hypothetical protein